MDRAASQLIAVSEQQFLNLEISHILRKDCGISKTHFQHRQHSAAEFVAVFWGSPALW